MDICASAIDIKYAYLANNVKNRNSEEKLFMLTNRGYLCFNQMGDLVLFPIKVQINEYSMANILSFVEVVNIAGAHIKMDTSKENLINFQIKDGKIIQPKSCAESLLYTNLNDPTMITNPNNVSLDTYYYPSIIKQNSIFLLILKLKERRKFESYSNIFTGRESQILRLIYKN